MYGNTRVELDIQLDQLRIKTLHFLTDNFEEILKKLEIQLDEVMSLERIKGRMQDLIVQAMDEQLKFIVSNAVRESLRAPELQSTLERIVRHEVSQEITKIGKRGW